MPHGPAPALASCTEIETARKKITWSEMPPAAQRIISALQAMGVNFTQVNADTDTPSAGANQNPMIARDDLGRIIIAYGDKVLFVSDAEIVGTERLKAAEVVRFNLREAIGHLVLRNF